jgi:hypothetical protein
MKLMNVITKIGLLSSMLLVASVAVAQGQSLKYRIKANIPFDFSIGEKKLPAGTYLISRAVDNDIALAITDDVGRSKAIRLSNSAQRLHARDEATLVFHQFGDQYFLFQVWPASATIGRQFPKSRGEREVQRSLAANSSNGETTTTVRAETVTIVGVLQ